MWLIDKVMFPESKIPKEVFEKYGIEYDTVDYVGLMMGKIDLPLENKDPVMVYVPLNCIPRLRHYTGCFYDELKFKCSVYMSLMGLDRNEFLNGTHVYSTIDDIEGNPEYYFRLMGENSLFFRPDSGAKPFTGSVWTIDTVEYEIDCLKQLKNIDPSTMVLISKAQNILEEYRFVIGDKKIIGASRYMVGQEIVEDRNIPSEVHTKVNNILEAVKWTPDRLWTLDMAMTEDKKIKILEINSFSCSGWYAAGVEQIIPEADRILKDEFKKYMEV